MMTMTTHLRYAAYAALLMMFTLTLGAASAGEMKVGVVDFTRALEVTEKDGALAKLKSEVDSRKDQLKTLEREILSMEQDLKLNGAMLSDEGKRAALGEYQKKAYAYQQKLVAFEQEMAQKRNEVLGTIHQKMSIIAAEIAQENNLDLMLEKNEGAVLYFNGSFDFTDELIKRYNAQK